MAGVVEELRAELRRLSPSAVEGDEASMQRCREIEAEISDIEAHERWQQLASRERERLEEEQRQIEEERRVEEARERYRELSEEKAEAVAGVGCLSNGLEKRRSRWCTG